MTAGRAICAIAAAMVVAWAAGQASPAAAAPVGAALAALIARTRRPWTLPRLLLSVAMSALSAAASRWAVVVTMAPAYPQHADAFSGAAVAAGIAAIIALWTALDARPGLSRARD